MTLESKARWGRERDWAIVAVFIRFSVNSETVLKLGMGASKLSQALETQMNHYTTVSKINWIQTSLGMSVAWQDTCPSECIPTEAGIWGL